MTLLDLFKNKKRIDELYFELELLKQKYELLGQLTKEQYIHKYNEIMASINHYNISIKIEDYE